MLRDPNHFTKLRYTETEGSEQERRTTEVGNNYLSKTTTGGGGVREMGLE